MFAVDKFKLSVKKEEKNCGIFEIGPLPKGYGVTIGNAIRRIILSSIEGAAVTSVKVNGVKHEYSNIPGVMDDVLTILLRIKQLAIKSYSKDAQKIELKVKGKKVVKAKDITLTGEVEIANPELHITELTESKAKLSIEMQVERGAGYNPSDEEMRGQVGVIPLDANFSPVTKVVMDVTKTRVEQQTDLDQIKLEIHTNGTVAPKEVLEESLQLYNRVTKRLVDLISGEEEQEETEKKDEKPDEAPSSDLDIDKLNLSARLTNSLIKAGYKNLTELEGMTFDQIKEIRGLGQKSAEELFDIMKSYKLEVKESTS